MNIVHKLKFFLFLFVVFGATDVWSVSLGATKLCSHSSRHARCAQKICNVSCEESPQNMCELNSLFHKHDFHLDAVAKGVKKVPRLSLAKIPHDIGRNQSQLQRKAFIKSLLPIVLMANEKIVADRIKIVHLHDLKARAVLMSAADEQWLRQMYADYRVSYGKKDQLLERVDVLPVSLVIAQAGIESGWGAHKPARDKNSFFGLRTLERTAQGRKYRLVSADNLLEGVIKYFNTMNTNNAYKSFRKKRSQMRALGKFDVELLTATLTNYSELKGQYTKKVKQVIVRERLKNFDQARLKDMQES